MLLRCKFGVRSGFRTLGQADQDVIPVAIGDDNADAGLLNPAGRGVFRVHATAAESTFLRLDVCRQVVIGSHFLYQSRLRLPGFARIDDVERS